MKALDAGNIPWRIVLASLVFVGGCGWAVVTILSGATSPSISVSATASQKPAALVAATPPVQPQMDESKLQTIRAQVAESVKASLLTLQTQIVAPPDAQAIANEAVESLLLAIDPSADRYVSYLQNRGEPDRPFMKMKPDEREEFLRTISQCFAGQQPDLAKVQVRWRYINGQEIEGPTERGQNGTPKRSIAATSDPKSSGLTVMEVIVPVPAKTLKNGTMPCRLGYWIGKTRTNPTWTMMKLYAYDIPGNVPLLMPPF